MNLSELQIGKDAIIEAVEGQGELRRHLLDMGLTPGTEVTLIKVAPMGDPIELRLRGYELTLRLEDADPFVLIDIIFFFRSMEHQIGPLLLNIA